MLHLQHIAVILTLENGLKREGRVLGERYVGQACSSVRCSVCLELRAKRRETVEGRRKNGSWGQIVLSHLEFDPKTSEEPSEALNRFLLSLKGHGLSVCGCMCTHVPVYQSS